jgi:NAD(P)-dependent dehydrogenase (short-subunit alcohol dehydrogenase family)
MPTPAEAATPGPAIVVGVGPGLGFALCRAFARAGHRTIGAARRADEVARLAAAEPELRVEAAACDATDPASVAALFEAAGRGAPPAVVVFNASGFVRGNVLDLDPAELERAWKVGVLGALHVAQAAGKRMVAAGGGTILFTGATAALRGAAGFAGLAIPKFGVRALAQSLARELGPKGVHVCHVVVDGLIATERTRAWIKPGDDTALAPDAIAASYLAISRQPRSAWTQELDLRPWVETF